MLSVADALEQVLSRARPLPGVVERLSALPLGRVLAQTVISDIDSPPFTKSMMDGFAVRAQDCSTIPAELRIVAEIAAGTVSSKSIQAGEAARIMTGAPIPAGADAVVMSERTETPSPAAVRVLAPVRVGLNILARGTEMKQGDTVLLPGSVLGPQELGILATVGRTEVAVHRRPRVAVLPTGDEIMEPPARPGPGQIRNSNGPMLLAQVLRAGGEPLALETAKDTVASLRSLIQKGLTEADVLILSGGVSAGKFDLVPGVLQELGVIGHFHKVLLKPGKPLFFGSLGDQLIFGLPGNPVSSFVCFELFIRPALRSLMGHLEPGPCVTRLPIAAEFKAENDRPTYWPARIEYQDPRPRVRALPWLGSADLRALHTADALLALPVGSLTLKAEEVVSVVMLGCV